MLAIHKSNVGFHARWRAYCNEKSIPYKDVDCYANDIIQQLEGCSALLWHHGQSIAADLIIAKQILFALEHSGFKVFPNFNTAWHFDDKIAQKYLFEAIEAPAVPSYVFYVEAKALEWLETADFPLVWKLRGGAGSSNVRLIRTKSEAIKTVKKSFGRGHRNFDAYANLKDRVKRQASVKAKFMEFLKGTRRLFLQPYYEKVMGREIGYVYFQKFLKDNDSDTRIIVIGDKAFALKRYTRKNDFRASGSGNFAYAKELFDERCVQIAFDLNNKIRSQSIAFDFVFDENNDPLVVEISYGFVAKVYDPCIGYWDLDLNFHYGPFNPQSWIIDDLIER